MLSVLLVTYVRIASWLIAILQHLQKNTLTVLLVVLFCIHVSGKLMFPAVL